MTIPTHVESRNGFRIWIEFDDGVQGEIDLSHLVGKGVFKAWEDRDFFEAVRLSPYQAIVWGEDLELCANAIYMEITGKTIDEVLPVADKGAFDA